MLSRDEVITAYAAVLGREPESEAVIDLYRANHESAASLMEDLRKSEEYQIGQRERANVKTFTRAALISIYKKILRRAPENESVIELHLAAHDSPESFEKSLLQSEEFRLLNSPYPGRKIKLADLDAEMAHLGRIEIEDISKFQDSLSAFWVDLPACNAAPSSEEYSRWVMATYAEIANRSYEHVNEVSKFDIDTSVKTPFPYSTGSARIVGEQLMAIGHVIQSMGLPSGAEILEMGFGWGNTTIQLALSGYGVTGIDIAPNFVELVKRRSALLNLEVDLREGSFFEVETLEKKFDAVLFFECFHHCADHVRLLKAIPGVLKPGGRLVLAGETINNGLPYPWGINPDGQAIFCIRRYGWLELCFREEYLLNLLDDLGWVVTKYPFPQSAAGITYVAERK